MLFEKAGERFVSYLSNGPDAKSFTVIKEQQSATSVSYRIEPRSVTDNQWQRISEDIYKEALRARNDTNNEGRLQPDDAVYARISGTPVTKETSHWLMASTRPGTGSYRLNPVKVTFDVPKKDKATG